MFQSLSTTSSINQSINQEFFENDEFNYTFIPKPKNEKNFSLLFTNTQVDLYQKSIEYTNHSLNEIIKKQNESNETFRMGINQYIKNQFNSFLTNFMTFITTEINIQKNNSQNTNESLKFFTSHLLSSVTLLKEENKLLQQKINELEQKVNQLHFLSTN